MSEATATKEEVKATPIFGSGTSFGAGTGFAGFTGTGISSAPAADANTAAAGEEDENEPAAEEECQADFKPVVQLDEVETSTGEEEEDALLELKCKLYRFDTSNQEWKERGVGVVKLLQHKESKRIRLLMRQDKTLKIRANHLVLPSYKLQEHAGNDKAWVWSAVDFADGEQKVEMFCMRFGSVEKAQEFKQKFEEAQKSNTDLLGAAAGAPSASAAEEGQAAASADADDLADEVTSKVTVADKPADSDA